jgi:hypothetical protein
MVPFIPRARQVHRGALPDRAEPTGQGVEPERLAAQFGDRESRVPRRPVLGLGNVQNLDLVCQPRRDDDAVAVDQQELDDQRHGGEFAGRRPAEVRTQAVEPGLSVSWGRGGLEEDPGDAPEVAGVLMDAVRKVFDLHPTPDSCERPGGQACADIVVGKGLDLAPREGEPPDQPGEQHEELLLPLVSGVIRGPGYGGATSWLMGTKRGLWAGAGPGTG